MDVLLPLLGGRFSAALAIPCPDENATSSDIVRSAVVRWVMTSPDGPEVIIDLPVWTVPSLKEFTIAAWVLYGEVIAALPVTQPLVAPYLTQPSPFGLALHVRGPYGNGVLPFGHQPAAGHLMLRSWQDVEQFLHVCQRALDAAQSIAGRISEALTPTEPNQDAPLLDAPDAVVAGLPVQPDAPQVESEPYGPQNTARRPAGEYAPVPARAASTDV